MSDKDLEARVARLEELVVALVGVVGPQMEAAPRITDGVLEAAHQRFKDRIRAEPAKARGQV